jgi:hypothetical protein
LAVLGQKATRKHVKLIFEEIDENNNGTIDFHEFIDVMQQQWKGVDLGKAVEMIKAQEAAETEKVDLAPVEVLYANLFGIQLHLRYFGGGMNAFLLVPAVWHTPNRGGLVRSSSTASLHWSHCTLCSGETCSTSCW